MVQHVHHVHQGPVPDQQGGLYMKQWILRQYAAMHSLKPTTASCLATAWGFLFLSARGQDTDLEASCNEVFPAGWGVNDN